MLDKYAKIYFELDHRVKHPLVARDLVRLELGPQLVTFGDIFVD